MKTERYSNERIDEYDIRANASIGQVTWSAKKSLWLSFNMLAAVIGGAIFFSWSALLLFIATAGVTLCFGHSIGMHRRLIHNSFYCPQWLENTLVYLGTLVGLGGPFTMAFTHDMRDWAQRQKNCHDYYAHRQPMLIDAWWQMHCDIHLRNAPSFRCEGRVRNNRFYRFIERYTILQQLPWALLFYALGGWGWVFWGVCARIVVGVHGHWLIGYFAHRRGGQNHSVDGASVQGFNVSFSSIITFGECWHNNHHAFPGSAKLGIYAGQWDPGWWVLLILQRLKLADQIKLPSDLPFRPELRKINTDYSAGEGGRYHIF